MTLIRTPTIPASFKRFDTHVTDADQFFNVRDAQVARENLNVLVARRNRHPLLVHRFRRTGYTVDGQYLYGYGPIGYLTGSALAYVLGPFRVRAPSYCKALILRLRGNVDNAGGDALVYPFIKNASMPSADYEIIVTGTAEAEYEIEIPLPSSYSGMAEWRDLMLAFTCEAYGADEKGAHIVVAAAGQVSIGQGFFGYVDGTSSIAGGVGSLLYFVSPAATINPQKIVTKETITVDGSTYYRAYVGNPWNVLPQAGDTFNTRALAAFEPVTLTVLPKAITDFGTVAGLT